MTATHSDRLELRVPPDVKERLRRAAEHRGESLTRFVIDALTAAADRVLDPRPEPRILGWATGTAHELDDLLSPAVEPDEWDALRG